MDIPTLLTGNAVLSSASAGVMFMVLRTRKTYPGFGWWTAGVACMALGAAAFVPGLLPEVWATLTLRNLALVAGLLMVLRGMRVFRGVRPGYLPELLVVASFVPLFGYFSLDLSRLAGRIAVFSAYASVLAMLIVVVTLRRRPAHFGSNDWLLALCVSVFGGLSFIRCVSQVLHPTTRPAFDSLTGYQSFYILTQVLTIHLITLALININSQRIEHDHQTDQDRLRDSENRLVTILDNLGNHVYVKDQTGRYLYANRQTAAQFGRSIDDVLGRTDADLLPPESARQLRAFDQQVLESGEPSAREETLEDANGSTGHFWSTKQPLIFQGGPALIGVSADISQVKHLEASVCRAKEFAETLIETANVTLLGLDAQGCVLFINAKGEEVTGYRRGELLGRNWFELMLGSGAAAPTRQAFDQTMQGGQLPRQVENTIRTPAGAARHMLWWNSLVQSPDGQPIAVSCGIDVTEQRQAEAELAEHRQRLEQRVAERTAELARLTGSLSVANEQLQAIFDAASSGILLVRGHTIERCNRRLAEMTGFSAAHLVGQHSSMIDGDLSTLRLDGTSSMALLARGETISVERRILRQDGSSFLARLSARALDTASPGKGVVQLLEDITAEHAATEALRRAKDAAEEAGRAKATFLANMSHEIRTPMNAIIGLTHLMSRDAPDPRARDRLAKVDGAARHLLQVINDILDVSKIDAGKLTLEQTDFALDDVLDNSFGLLGQSAADKAIELVLDTGAPPDGLPDRLRGDPTRLAQALLNLLSNAVKFTDRGWVRLRCRLLQEGPRGLLARFEITDTGVGVDEGQQAALFNAFEQADASITRRHGGTGLGLALTRNIARLMGGDAGFSSVQGQGSSFWFTAWLAHAERQSQRAFQPLAPGLRALLIDDLAETREALGRRLQALGLSVVAHDGVVAAARALAQAQAAGQGFDLLLIDGQLPPIDGQPAMSWLRGRWGTAMPPSIQLAGSSEADPMTAAGDPASPRFDGRLVKPIATQALRTAVHRLLREAHVRPEPAAARAASDLAPRFAGQQVLLVEDNPVNQEVACGLLSAAGLVIVNADTGAKAVALALSRRFDAILMDVQMPVMDGLTAARAIRKGIGAGTPIIAMTAHAFEEDRAACLAAGMDDHVTKPVDPDALYAKLARWLRVPTGSAITA